MSQRRYGVAGPLQSDGRSHHEGASKDRVWGGLDGRERIESCFRGSRPARPDSVRVQGGGRSVYDGVLGSSRKLHVDRLLEGRPRRLVRDPVRALHRGRRWRRRIRFRHGGRRRHRRRSDATRLLERWLRDGPGRWLALSGRLGVRGCVRPSAHRTTQRLEIAGGLPLPARRERLGRGPRLRRRKRGSTASVARTRSMVTCFADRPRASFGRLRSRTPLQADTASAELRGLPSEAQGMGVGAGSTAGGVSTFRPLV